MAVGIEKLNFIFGEFSFQINNINAYFILQVQLLCMETLKSYTYPLLSSSSFIIFLFLFLCSFNWYNSRDPFPGYATLILNTVGVVGVLAWFFAIGNQAKEKLNDAGVDVEHAEYFNYALLGLVAVIVIMALLSGETERYSAGNSNINLHISYTSPLEGAFFMLFLFTFVIVYCAKLLVSVELNREAVFKEYWKPLLMFALGYFGVWFIQPRIRKVLA